MKVKDLIKILEVCNPESVVLCRWKGDTSSDINYREACSYLVMFDETPVGTGTDALQSFSIEGAIVEDAAFSQDLEGFTCVLKIDQDYFVNSHVFNNEPNVEKVRREFKKIK